jgi:hypothetical protein
LKDFNQPIPQNILNITEKTRSNLFVWRGQFSPQLINEFIQYKFANLTQILENLPYSKNPINVNLSDARCLTLDQNQIDFVVTSPPYINVFNYHQNYRQSAELLGWDILKIRLSGHLGGNCIVGNIILDGGLGANQNLWLYYQNHLVRLTHPTNYRFSLSPQVRKSQF